MTVDNTAKLSGRRSTRSAKSRALEPTDKKTVEADAMSSENKVKTETSDASNGDAASVVQITARPVQ